MVDKERLVERPTLDEALESILERASYAARLAAEAYMTPDDEDENGRRLNPIHDYAESVVRDTVPLAVIGLFILSARDAALRSLSTPSMKDVDDDD